MSLHQHDRRRLLSSAIRLGLGAVGCGRVSVPRDLAVFKTPTCVCCDARIDHMREAGFTVSVTLLPDIQAIRRDRGMPDTFASCHTGLIGNYLVEGHVPAREVVRLLAERPAALGLAVPGMPLGSPGMETPHGTTEPLDVFLVLPSGAARVFANYPAPA